VNDTPFHKLINSSAFQKLRHELLTGELRNACIECPSRGITTADKLLARLRSTPGRAG
jgi:hypothetical protein